MPGNGDDIPFAPDGWLSGNKLSKTHTGNSADIDEKLKLLGSTLINDIVDAGFPEEEARTLVEHNLVGLKRLPHGQPTVCGSAEAVAMLDLRAKGGPFAVPPIGWQSGSSLRRDYAGANGDLNRRLKQLRLNLIRDLLAAGFPEADADALVDHNLIGMKKPLRGPAAVFGSPDATRILEDDGIIKRKVSKQKTGIEIANSKSTRSRE